MNLTGKYRAEVIDNLDPKQLGRLLVKCPKILGDNVLGWASSCLPPGLFLIPSIGDFVYIEFEDGSLELPIWVGIFATTSYIKDVFFPDSEYDPSIKLIVTAANRIVLNDTTGEISFGGETGALALARIGDVISAEAADPQGGTITITGTITGGSTKVKSL